MSLSLVTPATGPLISIADMRAHARVDSTDSDALLLGFLTAATRRAEAITRRQFVPATWRLQMDAWDDVRYARYSPWVNPAIVRLTPFHVLGQLIIEFPMAPLISVTSFQYVDSGGSTQTLDSSLYSVDTYNEPGRIIQNYGVVWPITRFQMNAVTITFRAGYADLTDTRLDPVKVAVAQIASYWYENREAASPDGLQEIPMGANALLQMERVGGYP